MACHLHETLMPATSRPMLCPRALKHMPTALPLLEGPAAPAAWHPETPARAQPEWGALSLRAPAGRRTSQGEPRRLAAERLDSPRPLPLRTDTVAHRGSPGATSSVFTHPVVGPPRNSLSLLGPEGAVQPSEDQCPPPNSQTHRETLWETGDGCSTLTPRLINPRGERPA